MQVPVFLGVIVGGNHYAKREFYILADLIFRLVVVVFFLFYRGLYLVDGLFGHICPSVCIRYLNRRDVREYVGLRWFLVRGGVPFDG